MSDGQGGGEGGGAGAAAIGGGGDGGEGGGAAASWRDSLPEAIRGDASLVNFQDVGALAQGYLDTKRTATERIDGYKTDDGLKKLGETLRPQDAAAYEISVPEGQSSATADKFRTFAHEIGLPPQWAKAVADFHNSETAAAIDAAQQASLAEVNAFKAELGEATFNQNLDAVRGMLAKSNVELSAEDLATLDAKLGSKNLLAFMFDMAARVGDPQPVEGAGGAGGGGGAMTPEAAERRWKQANADPAWRAAAKKEGTPEHGEYARLQNLIAQGRSKKAA